MRLTPISYSVLPALSLDGILHVSVVEGAFNMESFNQFVDELLDYMNPYDPINHNKNSVLIMDNCRIHKDPEMVARVHARYVTVDCTLTLLTTQQRNPN